MMVQTQCLEPYIYVETCNFEKVNEIIVLLIHIFATQNRSRDKVGQHVMRQRERRN